MPAARPSSRPPWPAPAAARTGGTDDAVPVDAAGDDARASTAGTPATPARRPGRAAWRAVRGTVADEDAAWAAWQAHDPAADGRLWIGVTSTGIYCRPVCRVRLPRRENCRFFEQARQAVAAGFRPCLRCRPEQAPGLSRVDGPATLADTAAAWLARTLADAHPPALGPIAARLGISERHLRRIFVRRHGCAPRAWWAARRADGVPADDRPPASVPPGPGTPAGETPPTGPLPSDRQHARGPDPHA